MDKPPRPFAPMLFHSTGVREEHVRQEGAEVVSIVMRTKDRPILLPRALRSVLSQRFADWHLYLVNDGGDHAKVETLLAEHATTFAGRLTVIHNPQSLGMEAASNTGLAAARGEYYVIHDDDDTWHPDFLERTVDFLSDPANASFVCVVANYRMVKEQIVGDRIVGSEMEPWEAVQSNIAFDRILAANRFPPITQLIRRSVLSYVGMYNPALPVLGDWEFNIRALTVGDFGVIKEPLAYYHHRTENQDPVYSNTVVTGVDRHQEYNVLLRNSALRMALQENPSLIGVLQPILHAAREQSDALQAGLVRLETELGRIVSRRESAELEAATRRLQAEANSARQQVEVLRRELDATTYRLQTEHQADVRRLQAELDTGHQAASRLQAELDAGHQATSRLQAELDTGHQAASRLQAELDTARHEAELLRSQLDASRRESRAFEATSRQLQEEFGISRRDGDALRAELSLLKGSKSWRWTARARWALRVWRAIWRSRD